MKNRITFEKNPTQKYLLAAEINRSTFSKEYFFKDPSENVTIYLVNPFSNSVDIHVLVENTQWDLFLEQGAECRPIDLRLK